MGAISLIKYKQIIEAGERHEIVVSMFYMAKIKKKFMRVNISKVWVAALQVIKIITPENGFVFQGYE